MSTLTGKHVTAADVYAALETVAETRRRLKT